MKEIQAAVDDHFILPENDAQYEAIPIEMLSAVGPQRADFYLKYDTEDKLELISNTDFLDELLNGIDYRTSAFDLESHAKLKERLDILNERVIRKYKTNLENDRFVPSKDKTEASAFIGELMADENIDLEEDVRDLLVEAEELIQNGNKAVLEIIKNIRKEYESSQKNLFSFNETIRGMLGPIINGTADFGEQTDFSRITLIRV